VCTKNGRTSGGSHDEAMAPPVSALVVVGPGGTLEASGPIDQRFPLASVTKILTSLAAWLAIEEGVLDLDRPAGPPGATVRHLLAHASGLHFDRDDVLARPGQRRIYSNRGIEVLADVLAAEAGMPFEQYLREGVLDPLGMRATVLAGSPAADAVGTVDDLARLAAELLAPTLIAPETLAAATAVAFPGLDGVLPGFGRQTPNDWGLGVELRDHKAPHWMPPTSSPRTFGHFGRAGGFLWVDPDTRLACGSLGERPFGPWAAELWPVLGDEILSRHRG
jgi:CubicO group peptidase (beta-lactamase class C family)